MFDINPIALRKAKTLWSFGHSECNRVKPERKSYSNVWKTIVAGTDYSAPVFISNMVKPTRLASFCPTSVLMPPENNLFSSTK